MRQTALNDSGIRLLSISFAAGLAIMTAEISASRLLAPFFGTSILVWTSIIGVVMASLAVGYYLGGKLADRRPEPLTLRALFLLAGFFLLITPELAKPLVAVIEYGADISRFAAGSIFIVSLLSVSLLFAGPMILLGAASPCLLKQYILKTGEEAGAASGKMSAAATAGSILGTFLPALILIPVLGTRLTIHLCGLFLILIAAAGAKRLVALAIVAGALFYVVVASGGRIKPGQKIIFEDESAYQYISVYDEPDGTRYMAYNEGIGIQSVLRPRSLLTGYYFEQMSVLPALFPADKPFKTLIVGLSGGTIASQLRHFYGQRAEITGVEIDGQVIAAAKKYFNLDGLGMKIVNADGRMALRNDSAMYDYIIIDAYAHEIYIPWSMTTIEFWELVRFRLEPGGLAGINVNASREDAAILQGIRNTMASVFAYVYTTRDKDKNWNYVVTASDYPINFSRLPETAADSLLPPAKLFATSTRRARFDPELGVLTDDKAPIERMTDKMALEYIFNRQ